MLNLNSPWAILNGLMFVKSYCQLPTVNLPVAKNLLIEAGECVGKTL